MCAEEESITTVKLRCCWRDTLRPREGGLGKVLRNRNKKCMTARNEVRISQLMAAAVSCRSGQTSARPINKNRTRSRNKNRSFTGKQIIREDDRVSEEHGNQGARQLSYVAIPFPCKVHFFWQVEKVRSPSTRDPR